MAVVLVLPNRRTPWSRTFIEKLIVTQPVRFQHFVKPVRFITVFTRRHHRFIPWSCWNQSMPSHRISFRSVLIVPHLLLGLPSSLFIFSLYFIFIYVRLSPLGTAATVWPIVPATDDDCGAIGGMRIGRGNRSTRTKPPQIPHSWPGLEPGSPLWEDGD
jgi:hypothetical protein